MLLDPNRFLLVAGPCALETPEICEDVASRLAAMGSAHPELQIVFKGSYDKANRTSLNSPRGPGLDAGLAMLADIRKRFGFPVLTDFHLPEHAAPVGEVVDVLQVPAFLCRQTDLLVAAAKTGRTVNVKKGQFMSPGEMQYVVNKLESAGAAEIWQTERGTTFGYQNLVVDMRSIPQMQHFGHPVIFDATHSVQMPGAGGGTTSGKREFIPTLASAAVAAGADGLFVETHPRPDQAISDGPNQVLLEDLENLLERVLAIWNAVRGSR